MAEQYCLRWNNHQRTLISVFDSLQERGCMVDCTLSAEGRSLQAHKVVLSACSPYLEDLLTKHYDKHPILILKDVKFEELKSMLDYMYRGEVNVAQDRLNTFLKAAESLQIKGLSDGGTDPPDSGGTPGATKRTSKGAPVSVRSEQLTVRTTNLNDNTSRDGSISPSLRKRRRRRGSDASDQESSSVEKQSSATPAAGPLASSDMLPTVPTSGPADASALLSIMENETEPTDSGISIASNQVPLQENVIREKDSETLIEPKSEFLDDDTAQDLPMEDDDMFRAGPSHGRSGNFGGDEDVYMAQDSGANAQGEPPHTMTTVKLEPMDPDEYRQWFGEDLVRSALAADVSAPTPSAVRPCYVRLENLMLPPARRPELPGRGPQPSPRRTASRSPTPPGRSRSRARSRARPPRSSPSPPARPAADRGRVRSRSVAPPNGRIRDRSTKPRSLSCSRKQERDAELGAAPAASGTPRIALGRPKSAGLNVVKCTLCLMPFTLQSSLKKHVQAHQACSPNRCLICGATMPDVAEAVQHFLSHPTYLPAGGVLMCQLCGKTFPRNKRSRLTQHVLLHTGEEPHRCATCKAGFRTTNLLRQHAKRLHGSSDAGVFKSAALVRSASFLCHSCPARRSSAKLLAEHLREAHGRGRDELTCYYCPKRLHSLDRLKEHLQRAHAADRPHACPRCPKRFHSRSHALRHQAIHSLAYKCSVCDQRFANTKLCLEHVGRAHPRAMEPAAVIARLSRNM